MPETPFVQWLIDCCGMVAGLEKEAAAALHADDPEEYRRIMLEKALLLAALYEDAMPLLSSLPCEHARTASDRLQRFSDSAARSLELESVFYMAALLFPEDHAEGKPNDLEQFCDELRLRLAKKG